MSDIFINACNELNVKKLIFIRHANANPITGENRLNQPHGNHYSLLL